MAETHEMVVLDQKPNSSTIHQAVAAYFDKQAKNYEKFNRDTEKRTKYIQAIDKLIVADLKTLRPLSSLLSIACGTGRREIDIQKKVFEILRIVGVDISKAMCKQAEILGLEAVNAPWSVADLDSQIFDAAFYLHAFGHVPTRDDRAIELKKIAQHLRTGGRLYIDALNLDDEMEWGPRVREYFVQNDLKNRGFELGDLFYRKIGEPTLSFFHYFSAEEMIGLLADAGFASITIRYIGYGKNFGKEVKENEGAMFVVAERK